MGAWTVTRAAIGGKSSTEVLTGLTWTLGPRVCDVCGRSEALMSASRADLRLALEVWEPGPSDLGPWTYPGHADLHSGAKGPDVQQRPTPALLKDHGRAPYSA